MGPVGTREFMGGERGGGVYSVGEFTFLYRLTHANTSLCSCALQAQLQSVRLTHATICRAFGTPGGILDLGGK